MSTAWGGGTWGSDSFGGTDDTATVTGVAGVGVVGNVTVFIPDAIFSITGVRATGTVGAVTVTTTVTTSVDVTGVKSTGAVGTVTIIAEQNVLYDATGVWATGKVGQVTTRSTWSFVDDTQDAVWQNITVTPPDGWATIVM